MLETKDGIVFVGADEALYLAAYDEVTGWRVDHYVHWRGQAYPAMVVGYLRTRKKGDHESIDAQRNAVKAWRDKHRAGYTIHWYVDVTSGRTPAGERPGLSRALQFLGLNPGGVFVVATVDRLSRSERHIQIIGHRLHAVEASFVAALDVWSMAEVLRRARA